MSRYSFDFSWDSTYGLAAKLLDDACGPGLVLDLGCGEGAFGVAAAELGREYVGFDLDAGSVERCRAMGLDAHVLDLRELGSDAARDRITAAIAGRQVAAVALLDVIEHLVDPHDTFTRLGSLIELLGGPQLVVSIPNVAHVELGAKLLLGRWDVTSAGLLDDTHVSLFSEERLVGVTAATGFVEVARSDNRMMVTEQAFPRGHPAVERSTQLRQFIELVRSTANESDQTYQFIRTYRFDRSLATGRSPLPASAAEANGDESGPFLSVIVRTQGARASLDDALTSLAAQDDADLEVLLVVHTADDQPSTDAAAVVDGVRGLVDAYHPSFRDRVHVLHETGGGRSAPLNRGLDEASGDYVAFLDDDDLVAAHWVAEFRAAAVAAPGRVLRALTLLQEHRRSPGQLADYEPVRGVSAPYNTTFSYVQHRSLNQSPICSWALPRAAIGPLGLRFDDDLEVLEDWELLLRASSLLGVSNREAYTSLYRRFVDGAGSTTGIEQDTWLDTQRRIGFRLDAQPVLLQPESFAELDELFGEARQLRAERDAALDELSHLGPALARIDAMERSRYWRMTAPLRWISSRRGPALGQVRAKLRGGRAPQDLAD